MSHYFWELPVRQLRGGMPFLTKKRGLRFSKRMLLSCDLRNILGVARPATSGRHAVFYEKTGTAFFKKNASVVRCPPPPKGGWLCPLSTSVFWSGFHHLCGASAARWHVFAELRETLFRQRRRFYIPLQEKLHTGILRGPRNIPDTT